MKKLFILFFSLVLLVSCNKTKNQETANNKPDNSNINNTQQQSQSKQELNQTVVSYEGSNESFSIRMTISEFTKDDLEKVKEEYGSDSDTYLSMQDDMPSYKLETYVNYVGEPVEGIDQVDAMSFEIKIDDENIINEVHGQQEVMQALQAGKNISMGKYYYDDEKRGSLPKEDSKILVKSTDNKLAALNFEIELNKEQ